MQYTIKAGDTLGSIAYNFGTTVEELLELNPQITNPNFIIAGQTLEVPDSSATSTTDETTAGTDLSDRIKKVTEYNLALVEAGPAYSFWQDGECIDCDGPPAFGVDGAPPEAANVTSIFCAGVGNLDLRLIGKSVPRNAQTRCYDGGTKAWNDTYGDVMIDFGDPSNFDLNQAEEGDVLYRPWQFGGDSDQGHWAYVGPDRGSGNICIQSFPWYGSGEHGGMNASYTIAQSHDGVEYVKLLKAKDWLGD